MEQGRYNETAPSATEMVDRFLDAGEYGREIMDLVFQKLGIAEAAHADMVHQGRRYLDSDGQPVKVRGYLDSGMAKRHGAEDVLLDVAELPAGDPRLATFRPTMLQMVFNYTSASDPYILALKRRLSL